MTGLRRSRLSSAKFGAVVRGVALAAVFCSVHSQAELYMVWTDRVELYRNNKIAAALLKGTVVEARTDPEDAAWLQIKSRTGNVYGGRREFFRTEQELTAWCEQRTRDHDRRLKAMDARIAERAGRMLEFEAFKLQVERDSVIYFEIPARGAPAGDAATQEPQRVRKLSTNERKKYLTLAKRELDGLEDRFGDLRKGRLSECLEAEDAKVLQAYYRARFSRFGKAPDHYLWSAYIVTGKTAPVFVARKWKGELAHNTVVAGKVNAKDGTWLDVIHDGLRYNSALKDYTSQLDWGRKLAADQARLSNEILRLELAIASVEKQKELHRAFIDELSYDLKRRGSFIPYVGRGAPVVKIDSYVINVPPGSTQVLDRNKAKSLVRGWEKELEDLRKTEEKRRDSLERRQQDLTKLRVAYEQGTKHCNTILAKALPVLAEQ